MKDKTKDFQEFIKQDFDVVEDYKLSKERKCPKCGNIESYKFKMERCIDGYTTCLVCQYMDKHNKFYQVESKELSPKENLDKAISVLQSIFEECGDSRVDNVLDLLVKPFEALTQLEEYIKRDIPMKPIISTKTDTICPNDKCKSWLRSISNHCPRCGQKLDRSGE